jgi:hypothetical protein
MTLNGRINSSTYLVYGDRKRPQRKEEKGQPKTVVDEELYRNPK